MAEEREQAGEAMGASRVEAFSDAVMAVIITIMAFELKAPATASFSSLAHRLPALLVYILSFTFVGIYWNNHHHLLRATTRVNGAVMWVNLLLLFWLSLVPVATEWVATQYGHEWPAAIYGIVALGAALSYSLLIRMIIRAETDGSFVSSALGTDVKGLASIVLYAAAIGLAFVLWPVSYALYASVSAIWFIPDRRLTRQPPREAEEGAV